MTFLSRPRPRHYFCPRGASRPRCRSRGLHYCLPLLKTYTVS